MKKLSIARIIKLVQSTQDPQTKVEPVVSETVRKARNYPAKWYSSHMAAPRRAGRNVAAPPQPQADAYVPRLWL